MSPGGHNEDWCWHYRGMVDGDPIKQHTVSQVVLRRFASRSSKADYRGRLAVLDRQSGRLNLRNPRGIFTINAFVEYQAKDLEQLWGGVESRLKPAFNALDRRVWPLQPEIEGGTLRDLVAVHWIRSGAIRALHDRLSLEHIAASKTRVAADTEFWKKAFEAKTGLAPAGDGALEWIIDQLYREVAEPVVAKLFSSKVLEHYQNAKLHFQRYRIRVAYATSPTFMIGDVPVITPNRRLVGLGPHQGVALMDAEDVFMPVSPNILVALGPQSVQVDLQTEAVRDFNSLQQAGYIRWLACQPDTGAHVALASLAPPIAAGGQ